MERDIAGVSTISVQVQQQSREVRALEQGAAPIETARQEVGVTGKVYSWQSSMKHDHHFAGEHRIPVILGRM
jgi:hypothetical protein